MASEQAMALYRKLNASGTAITNSNWREWERMASAAMKMQDFTPPGQSDSLHDLANDVGIEIQALKSRASRSGQPERFAAFNVEFDDKDTQAIIASGQAILRNIRTTGYAPADAVVAKIRSATTDAIAALKAGKMVPYSVNGKPMGTRRKNLNSGEVAALRARIVAAINVNQLKSFADQTVMIAEKDWIARGRPEHESRSRLYEIYDVAWKNWYYANELMSKGPNNTILVDRPVSRGFSRPGAKATFKVEDRFYFGKGRKERFADDRLAKFLDVYNRNEDNNLHSENVVLLAKFLGSTDDVAQAQRIANEQRRSSDGISEKLYKERTELNRRLLSKFRSRYPQADI